MHLVCAAAVTLALAVILGAFGAHALRDSLEASGRAAAWETAVFYQAIHGLALLAVGIWQSVDTRARSARLLDVAAASWLVGVVLFSGSLFLLGLGGPRWIGPLTPVGGIGFIAGWVALAVAALRHPRAGGRE